MSEGLLWNRQVLSNGLTLLLYPRPSALTAQVSIAIKYGSNDDSDEKAGKAHFLEHMLVGGSQKRIRRHHEIEKLGGCSNFETSAECTFTTIDVLPQRVAEASKVLCGLLFDEAFEEDKMVLERKVILNEVAEAADNPHDKVAEALIKCLFKKHPIRNPVLGKKQTIKELSLKEIAEARKKWYTPQNMVLILTGNFSRTDVETVLNDFHDRPNDELSEKHGIINEDSNPKKQINLKRSGLTQAYLCFGLRTPPAKHPDALILDLINGVLGLGESSRLFVELREKRALTYDFNSMNISGLDHGFFTIACAVKPKFLNLTRDIIKSELQKISDVPLSEEELAKSKNVIIGDILRAMDNPHELPRLITDTEIVYGDEKGLSNYISKLKNVTAHDIKAAAKLYFQEKNYSTAILTPK